MRNSLAASTLLDAYINRELGTCNAPGIAIGLTNSKDTLYVGTYGHADVAARTPVRPEHLFEIGSISKAFTSITILQLQERGLLDVHAPVERYLPWFQVRSKYEPITLHHLMSHTAGLIMGTDERVSAACEAWDLRESEVGAPPGAFFHYSNVGYKVLGLVLQEVCGKPIAEILRDHTLAPLGMQESEPVITHEIRKRLVVGYEPFYDDRPLSRGGPLAPATWLESNTADGSISSTAVDMCRYLRMLLKRGSGLLTEDSFDLLTQRVIPIDDSLHDDHYGYGLITREMDGHTCIGHSGGMVGYYADLMADMNAGLGVIVLTNGPTDPEEISAHALQLLRAAQNGQELPPLPSARDPYQVENAEDYQGVYHCGDKSLRLCSQDGRLFLEYEGSRAPLEQQKPNQFYTQHPAFDRFLLRFGRQDGRVVEAFHGHDWYTHESYTGLTSFDFPPEWQSYIGHYRSHNPWLSNFRVVLRKGKLVLIDSYQDEKPLAPLGEAEFRVGKDQRSPERIRFGMPINGQAMQANLSGGVYCRTFTP